MKFRSILAVCAVLLVSACDGVGPMEPAPSTDPLTQTWYWCQTNPECAPGDPSPSAAGVYIGDSFAANECYLGASGPGGDRDRDGFADLCEEQIARGLAPELRYSPYDSYMGREPYWGVHPMEDYQLGAFVRIIYALAYYSDGGSEWGACSVPTNPCMGHLGDSEYLVLDATYNYSTKHWVLQRTQYSAHGNRNYYTASQLTYPSGKAQSYPEAWVALQKHANYNSEAACDGGGFLDNDTCDRGAAARVVVRSHRNLGWGGGRLLNCVKAEDRLSLANLGYQECFWTATYFTGWSGDRSGEVEGYASILNKVGFNNTPVSGFQ